MGFSMGFSLGVDQSCAACGAMNIQLIPLQREVREVGIKTGGFPLKVIYVVVPTNERMV